MPDRQQQDRAWARLRALRRNVPKEVVRVRVNGFHKILADLEATFNEDLSHFRIPDTEVKPRIIAAIGSQTIFGDDCCDRAFFVRQIEAVSYYLSARRDSDRREGNMNAQHDYSLLNDSQLQDLMVEYRIPPSKRVDASGEHFYFDRNRAIEALNDLDAPNRRPGIPLDGSIVLHINNSIVTGLNLG